MIISCGLLSGLTKDLFQHRLFRIGQLHAEYFGDCGSNLKIGNRAKRDTGLDRRSRCHEECLAKP